MNRLLEQKSFEFLSQFRLRLSGEIQVISFERCTIVGPCWQEINVVSQSLLETYTVTDPPCCNRCCNIKRSELHLAKNRPQNSSKQLSKMAL